MLILGVFTQIAGVRSPSDEPIIGVPIKKNRKLLQRDELKKFDEDSEKDEDNHDDDKEGIHPTYLRNEYLWVFVPGILIIIIIYRQVKG